MPWEPCQIVFRNVIAKIIEQEKRVEVLGVSETKSAAEMHASTLQGRF
jgi:hypothetical protein